MRESCRRQSSWTNLHCEQWQCRSSHPCRCICDYHARVSVLVCGVGSTGEAKGQLHATLGTRVLTTKIGSRLDQPVWPVAPGDLTGLWQCSRSGRSRLVWPVGLTGLTGPNRVRVQLEIFIDLDLVIGFLAGQVYPPYKYKGPRPIETSNRSKYINTLLFFIFIAFTFVSKP